VGQVINLSSLVIGLEPLATLLRYSTDLTNESLVRKVRLVCLLLASGHLDNIQQSC